MRYINSQVLIIVCVILALATSHMCLADSSVNRIAQITSNSVTPYLVIGGLTLFTDHDLAKQEKIQTTKAMLATCLATELLKVTVREKRPNSNSRTSFPSGHTSSAFAMATCIADYEPKLKIPAYAIATAIGWSRVEVDKHYWHDVAAGAALGYFTAKQFTGKHVAVSPNAVCFNWQF